MADQFVIRLIEAGDRVTGLSLGDPDFTPLKLFLQKHAKAYQHQSLARTYGTFLDDKIIGYITLVCGEVVIGADDPSLIDDPEVAYKFPHYPAVKIARLAVDKRHRKKGIGPTLVDLALGTARDVICPAVGCRFVMVDSKAKSVAFYLKHGFTMLDTVANKSRAEPVMFVDLHKTA